jgi:hypothetical protein
MAALDKSRFAAPKPKKVSITDFGDTYVRSIREGEFERLAEVESREEGGKEGENSGPSTRVLMIRFGVCDEAGVNVFGDEDFDLIRGIAFPVANELIKAIREASGLEKDAVERAEKN